MAANRPSRRAATAQSARIALRPARRGDDEALGRHAQRAFRVGTDEGWIAYFRDNAHREPEDTLVAEVEGSIAGQASTLSFIMSLAGEDVPMKGYAAVAVAPEHRQAGVADVLMRESLMRLRKAKCGLAMLYPFHVPYYARFGFGRVEWAVKIAVSTDDLPSSPFRHNVRRLDRERDLPEIKRLYEEARGSATVTGPVARSDWWWSARVLSRTQDGFAYVNPSGGRLSGYLLYDVPESPPYPSQAMVVKEMVAVEANARRGLYGALHAMGNQIARVALPLSRHEALAIERGRGRPQTVEHYPFFHVTGTAAGGAMARIVDLEAFFAGHPALRRPQARGEVGLDVSDPLLPASSRSYDLVLRNVGATIERGRAARERLALGIDRLSQIALSAVPARVLLAQGLIEGSARAAALLDSAFAGPEPFLMPMNGF